MTSFRVATVLGARPQFIKSAPVSRAIDELAKTGASPAIDEIVVHTGQHYDREMSAIFFEELELRPPAYHLGVGSGPHGRQTGLMLARLEQALRRERPDLVLVYGDTNSTLAGALAAAKLGIPVGHVEAGLRSYRRGMPEEINRVVTDHVAALLFCPTRRAVDILAGEGVRRGVHLTGDVMYDAALQHLALAQRRSKILETLSLSSRGYALATIHRAENTDQPSRLRSLLAGLGAVARDRPVVWPVHPRVAKALEHEQADWPSGLIRIPPASYFDMLMLSSNASLVLTDSGGVQREAFFFRVPCVTLREETEWTETVEGGWNQVVGVDPEAITRAAKAAAPGRNGPSPFGSGDAARQIVAVLNEFASGASRP